jgi:UDP-N-acetylmuramate--alanine ligase
MIRTGIFFGGPSREREISFAGGRTVFDNLHKGLFEPLLFFVDSRHQLIELDWPHIYKGTIRDFYPPASHLPASTHGFQIYDDSLVATEGMDWDGMMAQVGRACSWESLPERIDLAFLALHGQFGEDGQLQGLLESLGIPYTGSGIRACTIGMDKAFQKKLMHAGGFKGPTYQAITRPLWEKADPLMLYQDACKQFGDKVVIRPANQGSSIGVSIIPLLDPAVFMQAVDKAFFRHRVDKWSWHGYDEAEKVRQIRQLGDLREGLGFPLLLDGRQINHPEALLAAMEETQDHQGSWLLEGLHAEHTVLLEGFLAGREFSCIVIRHPDGSAVALPPTEIIKGGEVFDYRSKYLPGLSRKETPIQLPEADIERIRKECERLFHYLDFQVYARIDGFILPNGDICLNDPNTTSGMLPSSFFFHQAAEIGLNPSQFLTYIIRTSLEERLAHATRRPHWAPLLKKLDEALKKQQDRAAHRQRIAVLLGGYSSERHISVESGRNIYEKLASSAQYDPLPVFLTRQGNDHQLYTLPIHLLLKDNADDILEKAIHPGQHPVIGRVREQCAGITARFANPDMELMPRPITYATLAQRVDGVFIALHGRPGEDGEVQRRLEAVGLPYNGSPVSSAQITIDKYRTLQILREHGFKVADQVLGQKSDWLEDPEAWYVRIEERLTYPLIGKPVDDGCSSAVKLLRNRESLEAFTRVLFRDTETIPEEAGSVLRLMPREEIPQKTSILFESLIHKGDARHFLEITGGLYTRWVNGELVFEVFEPSEALAGGEVLSLEEKFLAGEGQNITPARFSGDADEAKAISVQVRHDLERAARILGVKGYARIDAFVKIYEDRVETWIIEVNSLPGMTPATCIFHQASLHGLTPFDFIDQILSFSHHDRLLQQPV